MKISLVMTSMGLGGVQQSIVPYSLALQKLGHEVQLLVVAGSGIVRLLAERGLDQQAVQLRRGWKLFRHVPNLQLRKELAKFSPDLVIGFAQMGFFEAERAARPLRIPVITRVGSMRIPRLKSFRRADGWLATTTEMKDTLVDLGCPAKRIFLVPNFLAESSRPRAAHPLGTPPLVGSLGRFVQRKGFHVLIDAIAMLQKRGVAVRCDIAGDGKTLPELARQIEQRGAAGYIRLVGWLGEAQKLEFLERVDLFVSPSLDEPFGFVYLDAMRVGVPIITSPTVGARYIFAEPGSAEFVPFADPAALADAIEQLLADDRRREALGRHAAENYAARFSLEAGMRSLEHVLQQMPRLNKR